MNLVHDFTCPHSPFHNLPVVDASASVLFFLGKKKYQKKPRKERYTARSFRSALFSFCTTVLNDSETILYSGPRAILHIEER